jgi:hypothetical protein
MPAHLALAFETGGAPEAAVTAVPIVPGDEKYPAAPIPVQPAPGYVQGPGAEDLAFDLHTGNPFTHIVELRERDCASGERQGRYRALSSAAVSGPRAEPA